MSDMFDLDAAAAEETREPLRFTWKGQEWTLAHLSAMDRRSLEVAKEIEKSADDNLEVIDKAFRLAMGDEQYARFDKLPQPITAMGILFRRWLDHNGMTEGESEASSGSSESTAGPSKRPSKRTTRASGSGKSSRAR